MKTILVTGATGSLGSKFVKRFAQTHKIVSLKRTTSSLRRLDSVKSNIFFVDIDKQGWEEELDKHSVDMVFHLATNYGQNGANFSEMIESNLHFPLKVLDYAVKRKVGCFFNVSTALDKFTNSYSLSKQHFAEWLYLQRSSIKVVNFRTESIYGVDDNHFISRLAKSFMANEASIDLTNGMQRRDFIHFEDVLDAFELMINKVGNLDFDYKNYDLGSGKNYSIREVVEMIISSVGNTTTKVNWGAVPYRDIELMDSVSCISELCSLGWHPRVDIKEGIELLVDKLQ